MHGSFHFGACNSRQQTFNPATHSPGTTPPPPKHSRLPTNKLSPHYNSSPAKPLRLVCPPFTSALQGRSYWECRTANEVGKLVNCPGGEQG